MFLIHNSDIIYTQRYDDNLLNMFLVCPKSHQGDTIDGYICPRHIQQHHLVNFISIWYTIVPANCRYSHDEIFIEVWTLI